MYQQGTFAPDSNYRWVPSIVEDKNGDIALGYSVSGSSMFPAIRFTGRVSTDPLGTTEIETDIVRDSGSQQFSLDRWGDYSSMSVDLAGVCTFSYTGEFLEFDGTFNWSTRIASFTFPGCTSPTTPGFSLSSSPGSATATQGSAASYTMAVTPSGGLYGRGESLRHRPAQRRYGLFRSALGRDERRLGRRLDPHCQHRQPPAIHRASDRNWQFRSAVPFPGQGIQGGTARRWACSQPLGGRFLGEPNWNGESAVSFLRRPRSLMRTFRFTEAS